MRKAVSIKLDTLSKSNQKMINNWLDKQLNQQQSLATVLVHFVNSLEYKNEDIMSVEMQHLIHTKGLSSILTDDSKPVIEEPKKVSNTTKSTVSSSKTAQDAVKTNISDEQPLEVADSPVNDGTAASDSDITDTPNTSLNDITDTPNDSANILNDVTATTDASGHNGDESNEKIEIVEEVDESLYDD